MSVLLTLNICKREKNLAKECSEMRVIDLSIYILYDINFQENEAEIWTKKFVQGKMKKHADKSSKVFEATCIAKYGRKKSLL